MQHVNPRRCGALAHPDGSVRFRVWAPRASKVELVLIGEQGRSCERMEREEHGYFHRTEWEVPEGQRYAFRLDGGPERPDPCSLWQPEGVHGPSAVVRPGRFAWTDQAWKGINREELVFYEVHVGTFTPEGTFDAIIPRLPALRELGITALELMPVSQFPGTRNWGYDGVHPCAAQNSYGGPHGLQRLVNACHNHGLALFLDVVCNHLGPDGNYLAEFGPYFTDRYKTPWGQAINYDGSGSDPVRDYVLVNVATWLEEFHVDGLRLDAVHAIFDLGAKHVLAEIEETARKASSRRGQPLHVIAESDLNDPRLLLPPERGGHGLDGTWADDFHHALHVWLTGERQGYYEDFGKKSDLARVLEDPFLYAWDYSPHRDRKHGAPLPPDLLGDRFVVCLQNHDQVGNRARGDRLSTLVASLAKRRLASSMLLLSPYLPLLFMGEEYGETRPFPFFCSFSDPQLIQNVREGRRREFAAFAWQGDVPDPQDEATFASARLSWSWPEGSTAAALRRLHADLLAARRRWPALRDHHRRPTRMLPDKEEGPILELIRGGEAARENQTLRIYFNLSGQRQPLPVPVSGQRLLFSSEAAIYQGERREGEPVGDLLPWECQVFGPAT